MKNRNLFIVLVASVCSVLFGIFIGMNLLVKNETPSVVQDTVILDKGLKELTLPNVWYWLNYFDVECSEIVLSQVVLECGWNLDSVGAVGLNNIFGFQTNVPLAFGHWIGSVIYYKQWQDNFYTGGDYFEFLNDYGYAEDSLYVNKLKFVHKRLEKMGIFDN